MCLNLANMAILLSVKPYAISRDNRKEFLGELLNLFVSQMFYVLLNVDMDEGARSWLERIKIGVLCLTVLGVSIVQLCSALLKIRLCCRRKCCR